MSFHGVAPWKERFESHERYVGVMFAGSERNVGPQIVYVASNSYWEELNAALPQLPMSMRWVRMVNTWDEEQISWPVEGNCFTIGPRSVMVFVAK